MSAKTTEKEQIKTKKIDKFFIFTSKTKNYAGIFHKKKIFANYLLKILFSVFCAIHTRFLFYKLELRGNYEKSFS